MAANNPHLQKKRSSKRGLGRSFMRRITEIPESMSRQCSKEEKDGSVEGGGMSRSGSYKGTNLDSSSSSVKVKDDASSKQMAASLLKKSHSTYDQTRDTRGNNVPTRHGSYKEAPLHDSMMKKKLAKKASERTNSDSLDDSAPLVYRSVSAHNLMAERKPLLHPKPPPLQKSLSTVTSAKEKALLLMNRGYLEDSSKLAQDKEKKTVVEDSSTENEVSGHPGVTDAISEVPVKYLQRGDTSERTVSSLLEGGSSQDTVHPCESVATPSMPQKHVTYAPFRSVSINIAELPGRRHQAGKKIPPEPPIRQQSLCHSLERKDVSWDSKDQTQASSQTLKKYPKDIPVLTHVCPSEMKESVGKPELQGVLQAKDNALQSSLPELKRLASLTAEVCPWEGIEVPTTKKKDPEVSEPDSLKSSPEKLSQSIQVPIPKSTMKSLGLAIRAFNQSRLKASIRAKKDEEGSQKAIKQESSEKNETLQTVGGTLKSVEESPKQQVISGSPKKSRPKIVSKQSTICPWDEEEEASPSSHKNSLGKVFEVCPWEASKDGLTQGSTEAMPSTCADEISPNRLDRINSQRESVCPWETIDNVQTRGGKAQEEASGLHGSKDNKELSLGTEIKKCPDLFKPEQKKSRSVESHKFSSSEVEEISKSTKTQICPWEAEELPLKPAMSVEDIEGSSKKKSTTPRTAAIKTYQEETICPWETITGKITAQSQRASDNKANIKTAICPWETSGAPPEEPRKEFREGSKGVGDRKLRSPLLEERKDRQSIPQEAVCPWENAGAEDSSAKPAGKILDHNKVVLNNSISGDSKKVEVCPWETKTAEVCPWEVVSSTLEKGMGEMEEEPSKGITLKTPSPLKALEGNMKQESVCPWEDTKAETTLLKPSTKPLGSSKASSSFFQTKKAEIVPWETQEAGIDTKTAICPWESGDIPVLKREFAKDGSSVSKEENKGTKHTAPEEGGNNKRDSVCPWESTEDKGVSVKLKPHVSKFSSKKSDSSESLKTAIYPWETEGIEVSTKADICPWDVTLLSSDKRSSKQDSAGALRGKGSIASKTAEKTSSPKETISSWETTDIGDLSFEPSAKSQSLSKVRSKTSNKTDSLKAEVCPWESQEVEPSVKADVCPWEGPESPAGQKTPLNGAGALESQKLIPLKQTGVSKITEKASSPRENICPWEIMGTNDPSSQPSNESSGLSKSRSDTLKSEVCPWESQKVEPSTKTDVCPGNESKSSVDKRLSLKRAGAFESSKSTSLEQMPHFKSVEQMSSPQESVCPWDNVNPSELSPKPEQLKLISKKSGSAESLKAEVCPWEVFEEGVLGDQDDSKAHQREENRTTFPMTISKAMERLSRSKEEVCPWESMELEEPSGRSADQILSKAGSKKSGSTESIRSEICPWEFTEEKEESAQVEVCPWAVAVAPFEKGKLKQNLTGALKRKKDQVPPGSSDSRKRGEEPSFKKIEKSKSHQESASIWESMEFNKPPAKNTRSLDLLQVGCKKSGSAETLKAEVCPWESQEVGNHAKAEIFPWEEAEGLLERRNLKNYQDTVSSDETSTKPTRRTLKTEAGGSNQDKSVRSPGESVELSHSQTSKVTKCDSKKSVSAESVRAEICPWETAEEPSDKIERYPTKTAPEPFNEGSLKQNISQGKTQLSPVVIKVEGEALSKRIEKTCSHPGLAYSQKSIDKQPITSSSKSLDLPKVASVKSDSVEHPKAEICPWEIQEAGAVTKTDVCPWEVAGAPYDRETSSKGGAAISKRDLKVDSKSPVETDETPEKGSSARYSACSQESPATVDFSLSKTSASPSSKKPDSSKSKKTEICPWEAEQVGKEEPCPWEARKVLPTKDKKPIADASVSEMSGVHVKRSQSKHESLPGHKPLCRSLPETTLPIDFSKGSSSMVDILAKSRHDGTTAEISPCETEKDTTSTRKDSSTTTKTLSEVCPWEMEGSSSISTKSKSGGKSPSDKEESPCKAKSDICPWDCE